MATLTVFVIVLTSLFALLTPWPIKILIDYVLDKKPMPPVIRWLSGSFAGSATGMILFAVAGYVIVSLIENILTVINTYLSTKIEQFMVLDFRSDLFRHAQRLSLAYHDQKRSGMLIYAINFQGHAAASLIMTVP